MSILFTVKLQFSLFFCLSLNQYYCASLHPTSSLLVLYCDLIGLISQHETCERNFKSYFTLSKCLMYSNFVEFHGMKYRIT